MACYYITYNTPADFYKALQAHDIDLVVKMVKCVLSAIKRKKETIDIFDITMKDTTSLTFNIDKSQYMSLLDNCLNTLISYEEYESCAEIVKIQNRKVKKLKEKVLKA